MIIFTGDINLTDGYFDTGFGVGSLLANGLNPFSNICKRSEDCWIGNFEGVASEVTNKVGAASKHFRVSPKLLNHIGLIDFYGFANNHAMQHGGDAYDQTVISLEECGHKVFGTESHRSLYFEHQGRGISVTAFSQRIDVWGEKPHYWHNPEYSEIEDEVDAQGNNSFKVAYIHWGNELINYPSSQQKRFAHWLIDAGFDLVIGMHPHILQGYEVFKGKYIFYSIGNFVFDMAWEPTHYGAIVNLDFTKGVPEISYDYIRIEKDFKPTIVNVAEVPQHYRFERLNELVSFEENSEEYHAAINQFYRHYRKANHKDIALKMIEHPSGATSIIKDFIKRRF